MLLSLAKITKKQELLDRAIELYNQDYTLVSISKELDIHSSTLRRWFREKGIGGKKTPHEPNVIPENIKEELDAKKQTMSKEERKLEKHSARTLEDELIKEVAEGQASPAEAYQAYVAATAIKLIRDGKKNFKTPKTPRDLDIMDQIARRNLGLNSKSGGGPGKVQIDISILNNTKASKGGAIDKNIIDVDPIE